MSDCSNFSSTKIHLYGENLDEQILAYICCYYWLFGKFNGHELTDSGITLLSTATKGVTTPVTLGIAESIGSSIPLAVAMVVICGIYGGLAGPPLLKKLGITDPRAAGFGFGINSHTGGVARAFEIDATMGTYASFLG